MYENYPFVMGIEFGAISSGVSIAHTKRSMRVYTINNRELTNNPLCKQVPTSLIYRDSDINNPDKIICDIQESEFRINDSDIYIRNIKEIAYGYPLLNLGLTHEGLTREKLVADYLRCIHEIAVRKLVEVQFDEEHKHLFESFKVDDTRYCVACPREQKAFIGQCFIDAGIINNEIELTYRLDFVTESEATAYNMLAWNRTESKIKASENFLVCNLGQTTLGISEIQAETTDSLSQVKVVNEYYGEGSRLLDLAFSDLLKKKIQEYYEPLDFDETSLASWNENFASEKKYGFYDDFIEYDSSTTEENETNLGIARNLDDLVSGRDLNNSVFEPAVTRFIENILYSMRKGEKLNGAIYKKIYITGRYGYESYFLEKLWAVKNGTYRKDIILIDYEIIDAVSRGAVHYAMRKKAAQIPFSKPKEEPPLPMLILNKTFPEIRDCDLIVGIDFGTTYSGISYAHGTEGKIDTISSWPNPTGTSAFKCPSVLLYSENKSIFSGSKTVKWGNEVLNKRIRKDEFRLEYFKLSLATKAALEHYKYGKYRIKGEKKKESRVQFFHLSSGTEIASEYYNYGKYEIKGKIEKSEGEQKIEKEEIALKTLELTRASDQNRLKQLLERNNITVEKVISDYLKAILEYAHLHIDRKKHFSSKLQEEGKTVYVLTVPAMWNENSKRIMVEAFEESSVLKKEDSLLIITEPEAAAISYDRILTNAERDNIKTLLVCDAGGGTVDVATFRMEKDNAGNKSIRQLCRGDGDLCGSSRLDKNFDELIYDFYKVTLNLDIQEDNIDLSNIREDFRKRIKTNFEYSSLNQNSVTVELPWQPDLSDCNDDFFVRGSKNQKIRIPYKKIAEEVFDPVVNDVINLLKKQMNRLTQNDQPDVILVVGGFSYSEYLRVKVQQEFGQHRFARIFRDDPVSRGAVSYAQNSRLIPSRIILQSYAMEVKTGFKNDFDNFPIMIEELAVDDSSIIYSKSRLEYFIYNGELAEKNSINVYKKRVYVEYPKNAVIALFTSDHDIDQCDERLRYVDPELHTKILEIAVDMPVIPKAKLRERIPFLVSLEIDELKGVTLSVKCERVDLPEYRARPKLTGHHLGYFCDTPLKKTKGSKKE